MKNKQVDRNDKKRSQSQNKKEINKQSTKQTEIEDILQEFKKGSDFINSLIHEYLLKREFLKTLDSFQDELILKIKSKEYYSSKFIDITYENSIEMFFNQGKKVEFFKIWNRLIPSHIKHNEPILERLEFFLQIYFSVYPLLPGVNPKATKEAALKEYKLKMQEFKSFLESKEIEMSKTTEYLAYYALPYVQNPREHPSYKQIFTLDWIKELKEKFKTCLINYVPSGKHPLLYDMYLTCENHTENKSVKGKALLNYLDSFNKNYKDQVPIHQSEVGRSENKTIDEYNKLKKKEETTKLTLIESQKKWTNFSLEMLNISYDLITNIKKQKSGVELPSDYLETMTNKILKYETFLKKNAEELEKNTSFNRDREVEVSENINNINNISNNYNSNNILPKDNSYLEKSILDNPNNRSAINQSIHINFDPSFLLDMPLIKSNLAKINAHGYDSSDFYDKINLILREIRLRITRKKFYKNRQMKQMTLYALVLHDLLGLRSKHVKIFSNLLSNEYTNLETTKLINALTNENRGRTYVLSKPSIIEEVVKLMIKQDYDSELRQNCLGIVQKFTLRSEPQKKLIDLDVIFWITNVFITEAGNLSDYTLEYGLALLMNLSLRVTGRDKCEKVSEKLLRILISYFHSESIQVKTCINGTLYSLFKRKKIKTEAKKLGLEKMFNEQLANPNEQMKKQIQYILDELNSEVEAEEKIDEEFEDENNGDEEEELLEDDYNEEDSISDELIPLHYQILGLFIYKNQHENELEIQNLNEFINNSNNPHRMEVSASIRRDDNDRPLRRPTTPMTNLSSTSNSQIFNQGRSIASKIKSNIKGINLKIDLNGEENLNDNEINIANNENNLEKENDDQQEILGNTKMAFEKKDKLIRTPTKRSYDMI